MTLAKAVGTALLVCISAFLLAQPELDIQEMGGDRLLVASTNQSLVLFRLVQPPVDELYLFNFKTRKFRKIDDQRIKMNNLSICPWKDGFVLFSTPFFANGALYFLNATGALVKSARFEQIEGWNDSYDALHFSRRSDGMILVSYQTNSSWELGYLGLLELDKLKFQPLISIRNSANDLSAVWVCTDKAAYIISLYSGKIRSTSDTYQPSVLLRKGEALRESKKQNPQSEKLPLFLRYAPIISTIIAHRDFIAILHSRTTEEKVKKEFMGREMLVNRLITTPLSILGKDIEPMPDLIVGVFKDQVLSFDSEYGTFQIQP